MRKEMVALFIQYFFFFKFAELHSPVYIFSDFVYV